MKSDILCLYNLNGNAKFNNLIFNENIEKKNM